MLGPDPLPFASEDVQLAPPGHSAPGRKAAPRVGQAPAVYLVGI